MPMFNDTGMSRAIVFLVLFFGPILITSTFTKNDILLQVAFWIGAVLGGLYAYLMIYQIWKTGK